MTLMARSMCQSMYVFEFTMNSISQNVRFFLTFQYIMLERIGSGIPVPAGSGTERIRNGTERLFSRSVDALVRITSALSPQLFVRLAHVVV